jgi:hypothetical protein
MKRDSKRRKNNGEIRALPYDPKAAATTLINLSGTSN